MIIEQNTNYAYKLKYMSNPTFGKVRELSTKFYLELPQELRNELYEALNRGIDILDSEPQMTAYIFAYGNMHQAKLKYALDKLSENFLEQEEINIIDYGCGQAIGTMCYADLLRESGYSQKVKTITLIEPSEICLKRAALHTSAFFPCAEIKTVNKGFDDLNENDIVCDENIPTLHILSNVLDLLSFDIYNFAELVKNNLKGKNQFICVAPYYNDNEKDNRMDLFASKINGTNIITRKYKANEFIPEKDWTCKISCFQKNMGSFGKVEISDLEIPISEDIEQQHTIYYEAKEKIEIRWDSDNEVWDLWDCCKWIDANSVSHEFSNGKGKIRLKDEVNEIGLWAFLGCSELTSITIPNSVTTIGYEAFCGCSGLSSFIIPDSVIKIEQDAFAGCSGLTAIYYNGDIAKWCGFSFGEYAEYDEFTGWIGFNPLSNAHNLYIGNELVTNLIIPNIVTEIKPFAFCGATCLTSVTIPNSIMKIGVSAFSGCVGLNSINIPNSVSEIGSDAFNGCIGLNSIVIPNSVSEIESFTFKGCVGLKSIDIPGSVTGIGGSAFEDCINLTSIDIPNSVTAIEWSAFSGCSGLSSITIPDSVTEIGLCAFKGCTGLKSIVIPNSVMKIGASILAECSNLKKIIIPKGTREKFKKMLPDFCNILKEK